MLWHGTREEYVQGTMPNVQCVTYYNFLLFLFRILVNFEWLDPVSWPYPSAGRYKKAPVSDSFSCHNCWSNLPFVLYIANSPRWLLNVFQVWPLNLVLTQQLEQSKELMGISNSSSSIPNLFIPVGNEMYTCNEHDSGD